MKSPILSTFDSVTEAPSTTSALYKLDEENLLETSQRQPSSNNVNDLYYVPSWAEERTTRLCWLFRAHQLGNMYVLHEVVKNSGTRRRLILGPQWQLLMILYVTLAVGTIVIYGCVVPNTRTMQIAVGVGLSSITLVTLTVVALKDPGIVPRHTVPKGQAWTFCDRCDSFRPPHSVHCSRCNVCIEEYDHHCAWSSKCIGRLNIQWFRVFLLSLAATLVFDVIVCLQRFFQHPLVIYY